MSIGTLLVLVGLILAIVSLVPTVRGQWFVLPASVICVALGVLLGVGKLLT